MTIELIYFFYMFVSLFFLILSLLLFVHNRRKMFHVPKLNGKYSLSVLIPAYNEERTIKETIQHVFNTDYKNLLEVIVINDGSCDNTLRIAKELQKKYKNLIVLDKKNSGKANSLNYALKFVKGDFIAIIDADSYPHKDAFSKMMGFFDDEKIGVVTATCTPLNRNNLLERLQTIEYKVIAFTRKLLEYIDSIYVAPGSLSIYRKTAFLEIGGFDPANMTEDIESTWHILKNGWKVRMCLAANVTTNVPNKFRAWWIQRVRWTVGGFQVLKKYFRYMFKHGMFGLFVVPFFAFGLSIGIIGVGIFLYLFLSKIIQRISIALYKINSSIPIIESVDLNITPSVLNYFGIVLFVMFLVFTIFVLYTMKESLFKKEKLWEIVVYMTLYLIIYPFMIIKSVYNWAKGGTRWR